MDNSDKNVFIKVTDIVSGYSPPHKVRETEKNIFIWESQKFIKKMVNK
jgi:hypothetical protein